MTETGSSREFVVRGYATAFLDLLGLANQLGQLEAFAEPDMDRAKGIPLLRQSVGNILRFRKLLGDYYNQLGQSPLAQQHRAELDAEQARLFDRAMTHKTVMRWFSDCCIISVPVEQNAFDQHLNGLARMLFGLAFSTIGMLAQGQPIRGGIDIGYAVEVEPGEILGSSLTKAYDLEKSARVPRIAVGSDLIGILQELRSTTSEDPESRVIRGLAGICAGLLCQDSDGVWIVDFLGESMRARIAELPYDGFALVQASFRFVCEKCASLREQADPSLQAKYEWLHEYYLSRVPELAGADSQSA